MSTSPDRVAKRNEKAEKKFAGIVEATLRSMQLVRNNGPAAQRARAALFKVLEDQPHTKSSWRKVLRALRLVLRSWSHLPRVGEDVEPGRKVEAYDYILVALQRGDPKGLGPGSVQYATVRCLTDVLKEADTLTWQLFDEVQETAARFYLKLKSIYEDEEHGGRALMADDSETEEEAVGGIVWSDKYAAPAGDDSSSSTPPPAPIDRTESPSPGLGVPSARNAIDCDAGKRKTPNIDRHEMMPWTEEEVEYGLEQIAAYPELARGTKKVKLSLTHLINGRFAGSQYTDPITSETRTRKERTYEGVRQHFHEKKLDSEHSFFSRLTRFADVEDAAGNVGLSIDWTPAGRAVGGNITLIKVRPPQTAYEGSDSLEDEEGNETAWEDVQAAEDDQYVEDGENDKDKEAGESEGAGESGGAH